MLYDFLMLNFIYHVSFLFIPIVFLTIPVYLDKNNINDDTVRNAHGIESVRCMVIVIGVITIIAFLCIEAILWYNFKEILSISEFYNTDIIKIYGLDGEKINTLKINMVNEILRSTK